MSAERFFLAVLAAGSLSVLFLAAVREGRFASPGRRASVTAAIVAIGLLIWLVPWPAR